MKVTLVDRDGYGPDSRYADLFWTPVVGPTCMVLWRRLNEFDGQEVDVHDLGCMVGVTAKSTVTYRLQRLQKFHAASLHNADIWVARRLPPLTDAQLDHLPDILKAQHPLIARQGQTRKAS